jgi:branched-chain amino acid transport system ATP-binding protein
MTRIREHEHPQRLDRANPQVRTKPRNQGVTILLIEQNAKQALQISDFGLVLEQGQTRIEDTAANILADPRIGQLFLAGGLAPIARAA